jgi:hypothetical protein
VRDRSATPALVLGLLSLPFGLLAPFAIWSGATSLWRIHVSEGSLRGVGSAAGGLVTGLVGFGTLIFGTIYWILAS